jgi:DMSO/TMAO reductase YedYZ molybdopterin-dependent catalytic subunit
VDISTYRLTIDGLVETPVELTYEDVLDLDVYERKITLHCVEGWDATILWKGALLQDIFEQASVMEEANTVIFHSVDGYTTSLPLETIISGQLILAYGANGLELPDEMGYPFILVAEDKLGYKWARWISEIELSDDPDYRGYWEQRGYSNNADLKN